jgi:hypothetical protein
MLDVSILDVSIFDVSIFDVSIFDVSIFDVFAVMLDVFVVMLDVFAVMLDVFVVMLDEFVVILDVFAVILDVFAVMLDVFVVMLDEFAVMLDVFVVMLDVFADNGVNGVMKVIDILDEELLMFEDNVILYICSTRDSIFSTRSIRFLTAPYSVYLICVVFNVSKSFISWLLSSVILPTSTAFGYTCCTS